LKQLEQQKVGNLRKRPCDSSTRILP